MKVFVPVNGPTEFEGAEVFDIDRAEYACVYDTDSEEHKILPIREISEKKGNLMLALKRLGIENMICESLPNIALELFSLLGINTYQAIDNSLELNIDNFRDNKLTPIKSTSLYRDDSACSSNCSSCGSSCG